MGNPSTEQTVAIIEAVADVVHAEPKPEPQPQYGWLLLIAVAPVIVGVIVKKWVPGALIKKWVDRGKHR